MAKILNLMTTSFMAIAMIGCEQITTETAANNANGKSATKTASIDKTYAGDAIEAIYVDLQADEDISADQAESIAEDLAYEISPDRKIWDKNYAKNASLALAGDGGLDNVQEIDIKLVHAIPVVSAAIPASTIPRLIESAGKLTDESGKISFATVLSKAMENLPADKKDKLTESLDAVAEKFVTKLTKFENLMPMLGEHAPVLITKIVNAAGDADTPFLKEQVDRVVKAAVEFKPELSTEITKKLLADNSFASTAAVKAAGAFMEQLADKKPEQAEKVSKELNRVMIANPGFKESFAQNASDKAAANVVVFLPKTESGAPELRAYFEGAKTGFAEQYTEVVTKAAANTQTSSSSTSASTQTITASPSSTSTTSGSTTGSTGGTDSSDSMIIR